jgi:hypothetical protein
MLSEYSIDDYKLFLEDEQKRHDETDDEYLKQLLSVRIEMWKKAIKGIEDAREG